MHVNGGRGRATWAVVVLAAASILVVVGALLWPTAEDRVRRVLLDGAEALQDKRVDDVMERVHPAFRGPRDVGRDRARQVLAQSATAYPELEVRVVDMKIEVSGDETAARAAFTVGIRGRVADGSPWEDVVARWNIGSRWEAGLRYDEESGWRVVELNARKEGG